MKFTFFKRLALLFRREKFNQELEEEMAWHRDQKSQDLQSAGTSPDDAHHAARREFGNDLHLREQSQDVFSFWFETTLQDFRFALRQLRKNPGFALTAILMLALGLSVSVAIFAFVDGALLKPIPFKDPQQLLGVYEEANQCLYCNLSYPDYLDWKKLNKSLTALEVYDHNQFTLNTPSGAEPIFITRVSDGFFRVLGITPILGRDFYAGEDLLSAPRTVMLSYAAWQKRFGGKPEVIGQTVILDDNPTVIIAVLPKDFHFAPAEPAEFWATLHPERGCDLRRSCHGLYGVGRMKDGITMQGALSEFKDIAAQLTKQYPDSNTGQGANVEVLSEVIVGPYRPLLLMLLAGAGLLLVIAGVNIASLLLVRSEARKREFAIRNALGAARIRLMRQFMTEGLLLVLIGSALGLLFAYWTIHILTLLIPTNLLLKTPFFLDLGLTPHVLVFTAFITLLFAILFFVTPTLRLSLGRTRDSLAEGSRGSAGNAWRFLGSKLVVLELATAVVLLVSAGLLGKSLLLMLRTPIGMQPDHLATIQLTAPDKSYPKSPDQLALARRLYAELSAVPGVKSVAFSSDIPINGWGDTTWIHILGRPWHGEHEDVPERDVTPEYFSTIGAKLVRGRPFVETGRPFVDNEDPSQPHEVIINQAFERKYFPGEDPLGKQLSYMSPKSIPMEIIGIVEDIKEGQLDTENRPALYFPLNQSPSTFLNAVVRTSTSDHAMIPALISAVHRLDPNIATSAGTTFTDIIEDSPSAYLRRTSAWLIGGFAAFALILGVVGLYGVIAYSVSQRTREIGVRMAIGAQRTTVYKLVLKEAGYLTTLGIVMGLASAIAAATLMKDLLFGVRSWDVPTLAAVAIVLSAASLLASFIPAHRAASVDPVEALRSE
ncbi:MAG TPA: ABC transporter permease [Candidatus Saccharimonadales bacterium]|nr:ABC transporter permease [Candidatus Saccharimonadales bacterium]